MASMRQMLAESSRTVDVKRWIGTLLAVLDSGQAHPEIWHHVGFCLLDHKAFLDYEDAINSGGCPGNRAAFCRWLLKLNPLCVSKDSILNDYDRLYQQPNETAQSFFQRFREWQHKAKNYGFHYEASSGFVTRLNRGLKEKVKGIVEMERQRGTPLSFNQIVVTTLEEDQTYRLCTANSIASGSRNNKQSADAPVASSSKCAGGSGGNDGNSCACYNWGKEGHLSSKCPEPKTAKQLKYKAKRSGTSGNGSGSGASGSLNAYLVRKCLSRRLFYPLLFLL
ncbi:hypothetical protein PTTG_28986 [Puccinia triticina 1-1 BBBD Race 1]|uniref:CCHC-type domain-containing protein n=1 Tax=Puccinia triticina (isolate 1-1 / race 1 (BBBD)) TaxID=630390 RepID=A0A180G7Y8_PUCT1|nr:hypothetical protein PTTG_28986 [Puccinia triticina 1-1 BBBD Race 1]